MLLQVSGLQLFLCVRVCACVRGKRAHKHMCTYGGGSRGNEEDEMMTICPLSCP